MVDELKDYPGEIRTAFLGVAGTTGTLGIQVTVHEPLMTLIPTSSNKSAEVGGVPSIQLMPW